MTPAQAPHKPVIGLVGGIGSGKSMVARQFKSLGCAVIDADDLAKQALDQPEVSSRLVQWWGDGVIGDDGRVDRSLLGGFVFNDPEQLGRLEGLIHPLVHQSRQVLREQYQEQPGLVAIVEDCPLLLEKHLEAQCDTLVFVEASRAHRLGRVSVDRGWSGEELARREKFQFGLDIKLKHADYVISNDAGEDGCLLQVRRVLSQILQDHS